MANRLLSQFISRITVLVNRYSNWFEVAWVGFGFSAVIEYFVFRLGYDVIIITGLAWLLALCVHVRRISSQNNV